MLQKWDKVAELLGVKMDVAFRVLGINKSREEDVYRVTKSGVKVASKVMSGVWLDDPYFPILEVLRRGLKCVEVPWKPRVGEEVWVACVHQQIFGEHQPPKPKCGIWTGDALCHVLHEHGLVYRTEGECAEHMKDDYERVTGEKWKW